MAIKIKFGQKCWSISNTEDLFMYSSDPEGWEWEHRDFNLGYFKPVRVDSLQSELIQELLCA